MAMRFNSLADRCRVMGFGSRGLKRSINFFRLEAPDESFAMCNIPSESDTAPKAIFPLKKLMPSIPTLNRLA